MADQLRIRFEAFGGMETASSRLRVHYLGAELRRQGHVVDIGEGSQPYDIYVFQKRRPESLLRSAFEDGALTVYDFDDNYLLEDVGTRAEMIAFMNTVDVVTVGSKSLLDAASEVHDRVWLFENPVDLAPTTPAKTDYAWTRNLGWFGNRTNLTALRGLELSFPVTTITLHGDIEWSVETIDDHLKALDLVLLPVVLDEWTAAKNANRLFKCAALGVPFLASRTPEHLDAVGLLDLPEWFLVGRDGNWAEAIDLIGSRYEQAASLLARARPKVFEHYGVEPLARRWLQKIRQSPGEWASDGEATASVVAGHDVDVVVLATDEPEMVAATLETITPHIAPERTITVVSASKLADLGTVGENVQVIDDANDFFDVYGRLAKVINETPGTVLYLRAGCRVQRGFWSRLPAYLGESAIVLPRTQLSLPKGTQNPVPPTRLDEILQRPMDPMAAVLPAAEQRGFDPRFLNLQLWQYMLRALGAGDVNCLAIDAPFVVVPQTVYERSPMSCYFEWVRRHEPELAPELPSEKDEWFRLKHILHESVVDSVSSLFVQHLAAVLSRYEAELSRRERTVTMDEYHRVRTQFLSRKQKHEEAIGAYQWRKEKQFEAERALADLQVRYATLQERTSGFKPLLRAFKNLVPRKARVAVGKPLKQAVRGVVKRARRRDQAPARSHTPDHGEDLEIEGPLGAPGQILEPPRPGPIDPALPRGVGERVS